MKLIAAYTLLLLSGKETPSASDITDLITKAGGEVDEEQLTTLLGDLEGKDIHALLAKGDESLKSVAGACGGGGGGGGGGAGAGAAAAPAAAAPEAPKEEEVDALDGGMDMFGGGGGGGGDY